MIISVFASRDCQRKIFVPMRQKRPFPVLMIEGSDRFSGCMVNLHESLSNGLESPRVTILVLVAGQDVGDCPVIIKLFQLDLLFRVLSTMPRRIFTLSKLVDYL